MASGTLLDLPASVSPAGKRMGITWDYIPWANTCCLSLGLLLSLKTGAAGPPFPERAAGPTRPGRLAPCLARGRCLLVAAWLGLRHWHQTRTPVPGTRLCSHSFLPCSPSVAWQGSHSISVLMGHFEMTLMLPQANCKRPLQTDSCFLVVRQDAGTLGKCVAGPWGTESWLWC